MNHPVHAAISEAEVPEMLPAALAYDTVAQSYDADYETHDARIENDFIRDMLTPMLCGPVVDIATGTGLLFDWFPAIDGYGFDISHGMVTIARQKHPSRRFIVADAGDFSPSVKAQTAVCLFGGLSYVAPEIAADCVDRVLAPGGRFFLMMFGATHLQSLTLRKRGLEVERYRYTRTRAKEVFRAYEDVRVTTAFQAPRVFGWLTRAESKALSVLPWLGRYQIITGRKPDGQETAKQERI